MLLHNLYINVAIGSFYCTEEVYMTFLTRDIEISRNLLLTRLKNRFFDDIFLNKHFRAYVAL